jgi:septal ring factor EnvC (AmiA/AmiB activator)
VAGVSLSTANRAKATKQFKERVHGPATEATEQELALVVKNLREELTRLRKESHTMIAALEALAEQRAQQVQALALLLDHARAHSRRPPLEALG